jgi:hypothetical protein
MSTHFSSDDYLIRGPRPAFRLRTNRHDYNAGLYASGLSYLWPAGHADGDGLARGRDRQGDVLRRDNGAGSGHVWALSSITVAKVALCREPVTGEANVTDPHCLLSSSLTGLVFLGNAVLVPGVRPDVAAAFPGYPNNNWGWGAQVLTNFLPGTNGLPLGNGTYKLHAIAADPAGFSTDLGTTTISANNAASILPFGTIDTPAQGETISGTDYVNFGWVVTPQPNIVPIDGSTITVHNPVAPLMGVSM